MPIFEIPQPKPHNLLVSHHRTRFRRAKSEIRRILKLAGDDRPLIDWSGVEGLALVNTSLSSRAVIQKCRELHAQSPTFRYTIKWLPADWWCESDLEQMKSILRKHALPELEHVRTWGMKLKKHRWNRLHSGDIVQQLAEVINKPVDLTEPDKWIRVDIIGRRTSISVLSEDDTFSAALPETPAAQERAAA